MVFSIIPLLARERRWRIRVSIGRLKRVLDGNRDKASHVCLQFAREVRLTGSTKASASFEESFMMRLAVEIMYV
jgi:hypothetical protein